MHSSAGYHPVMVVCGTAAHRLYEEDPTLVAEVLSPSTTDTDRREKALAFAACPSLRQYILIDPDRRRIEVAVPGPAGMAWQSYGPGMWSPLPTSPSTSIPSTTLWKLRPRRCREAKGSLAVMAGAAATTAARRGVGRPRR
jgi:Uma2 family endonuclease